MGLDSRDYYRRSGMGGFSYFPPVLKMILIINVVVFFIQELGEQIKVTYDGMIVPLEILLRKYFALIPLGGFSLQGVLDMAFYPWQLITYQFMHSTSDIFHIIFNMLILWMFGMEIENEMGSKKFLVFYLLCGFGAGLAQILITPLLGEMGAPTIGASGAVFGVMVAYAMYFPDRYIFISFIIPVKAKYAMAILVLIEFFSIGDASLVARIAHVGGAMTGLIFILLDRSHNFNFSKIFSSKNKSGYSENFSFKRPQQTDYTKEVEDANFYDINEKKPEEMIVTQEEIDRILDKISQSGYQNLTEKEKRILFEASRRK
jgi:membrane associated rhomboid family serine protease